MASSDTASDTSSNNLFNAGAKIDREFLQLEYMKTHEPWQVDAFPPQYMPHTKYDYFPPPTFVLGAGVTLSEYMHYASEYAKELSSLPSSFDSIRSASDSPKTALTSKEGEKHRPIPLQKVWTRSDTPYVLPVCSNYSFGKHFPLEECEEMLDDLERVGIKANIDWFLTEDYSQWEETELLDWSQQYMGMMAKRSKRRTRSRQAEE
ncbi:hypothetical protein VKT23_019923 [Stygiomarasmius scandens]|uniref:Uncharacterized protein n=1 Tax=Marasmiellus scandens TaxID=2682957 RepID=A0ABR1IMW9_9AGAR